MTKTRSTAAGEGVPLECRLWGDPPDHRGEMLETRRRRPVADRRRFHAGLCAGLLVFMAGRPALAQPGAELEIGGGYHAAFDLGGDLFTVPSTPTVDARATAWVSDRWGIAARRLLGLGGVLRGHAGVERRRPTYFQVLEDGFFDYSYHLLGVEALASKTLTDRLSIRGGVSLVVPIHVNPTVLLAWQL